MNHKILILLTFITGCSVLPSGPMRSENLNIEFVDPDWNQLDSENADYVIRNRNSGGVIYVSSLCKKYQTLSLKLLSQNLFNTIEKIQFEKNEERMFQDRKAYYYLGTGEMDGVTVHFSSMTFRKNHCLYDVVLTARKQDSFENGLEVWPKLLASIQVK